MKPEKDSKVSEMDESTTDSLQVVQQLVLLIVEARTPDQSVKGRVEGPHCSLVGGPVAFGGGGQDYRGPNTSHCCSTDKLECYRADQFSRSASRLWTNGIPVCVDILLFPACSHGKQEVGIMEGTVSMATRENAMLVERWTLEMERKRPQTQAQLLHPNLLVQAVRSYLHFSQISSWLFSTGGSLHGLLLVYRICAPCEELTSDYHDLSDIHSFPVCLTNRQLLRVRVNALKRRSSIPTLMCVDYDHSSAAEIAASGFASSKTFPTTTKKMSADFEINDYDDLHGRNGGAGGSRGELFVYQTDVAYPSGVVGLARPMEYGQNLREEKDWFGQSLSLTCQDKIVCDVGGDHRCYGELDPRRQGGNDLVKGSKSKKCGGIMQEGECEMEEKKKKRREFRRNRMDDENNDVLPKYSGKDRRYGGRMKNQKEFECFDSQTALTYPKPIHKDCDCVLEGVAEDGVDCVRGQRLTKGSAWFERLEGRPESPLLRQQSHGVENIWKRDRLGSSRCEHVSRLEEFESIKRRKEALARMEGKDEALDCKMRRGGEDKVVRRIVDVECNSMEGLLEVEKHRRKRKKEKRKKDGEKDLRIEQMKLGMTLMRNDDDEEWAEEMEVLRNMAENEWKIARNQNNESSWIHKNSGANLTTVSSGLPKLSEKSGRDDIEKLTDRIAVIPDRPFLKHQFKNEQKFSECGDNVCDRDIVDVGKKCSFHSSGGMILEDKDKEPQAGPRELRYGQHSSCSPLKVDVSALEMDFDVDSDVTPIASPNSNSNTLTRSSGTESLFKLMAERKRMMHQELCTGTTDWCDAKTQDGNSGSTDDDKDWCNARTRDDNNGSADNDEDGCDRQRVDPDDINRNKAGCCDKDDGVRSMVPHSQPLVTSGSHKFVRKSEEGFVKESVHQPNPCQLPLSSSSPPPPPPPSSSSSFSSFDEGKSNSPSKDTSSDWCIEDNSIDIKTNKCHWKEFAAPKATENANTTKTSSVISRKMFQDNLLPLASYDAETDSFKSVEEVMTSGPSNHVLHSPKVLFSSDIPEDYNIVPGDDSTGRKYIDFEQVLSHSQFFKSKLQDVFGDIGQKLREQDVDLSEPASNLTVEKVVSCGRVDGRVTQKTGDLFDPQKIIGKGDNDKKERDSNLSEDRKDNKRFVVPSLLEIAKCKRTMTESTLSRKTTRDKELNRNQRQQLKKNVGGTKKTMTGVSRQLFGQGSKSRHGNLSSSPENQRKEFDNTATRRPQCMTSSVENAASSRSQCMTSSVDNTTSSRSQCMTSSVDNTTSSRSQCMTSSVVNTATSHHLHFSNWTSTALSIAPPSSSSCHPLPSTSSSSSIPVITNSSLYNSNRQESFQHGKRLSSSKYKQSNSSSFSNSDWGEMDLNPVNNCKKICDKNVNSCVPVKDRDITSQNVSMLNSPTTTTSALLDGCQWTAKSQLWFQDVCDVSGRLVDDGDKSRTSLFCDNDGIPSTSPHDTQSVMKGDNPSSNNGSLKRVVRCGDKDYTNGFGLISNIKMDGERQLLTHHKGQAVHDKGKLVGGCVGDNRRGSTFSHRGNQMANPVRGFGLWNNEAYCDNTSDNDDNNNYCDINKNNGRKVNSDDYGNDYHYRDDDEDDVGGQSKIKERDEDDQEVFFYLEDEEKVWNSLDVNECKCASVLDWNHQMNSCHTSVTDYHGVGEDRSQSCTSYKVYPSSERPASKFNETRDIKNEKSISSISSSSLSSLSSYTSSFDESAAATVSWSRPPSVTQLSCDLTSTHLGIASPAEAATVSSTSTSIPDTCIAKASISSLIPNTCSTINTSSLSTTDDLNVQMYSGPMPDLDIDLDSTTKLTSKRSRLSSFGDITEGWDPTPPSRSVSSPNCMEGEVRGRGHQRSNNHRNTLIQQSMLNLAKEGREHRSCTVSGTSMVFNSRTSLPTQSSPAPLKRNAGGRFDYDANLVSVKAIKNAFSCSKLALGNKNDHKNDEDDQDNKRTLSTSAPASTNCLLGNFEESILNGRIDPVGTVSGFTAEMGASGSFCPKHIYLPVSAFFFDLSDDNAPSPYLGHINLRSVGSKKGYHIPKKGTVQVTLFNPNKTVVKMFVVMYDLGDMPPSSQTFIRQRTMYVPCDRNSTAPTYLRYLIHLRCASTRSGKIYLHTDIRLIFARHKLDIDAKTVPYEMKSFTELPKNPKYSPKK